MHPPAVVERKEATTVTSQRPQWEPRNPEYDKDVREAFAAQPAMALIGATIEKVEPGYVEVHLPCRPEIMSHYHEFVHGGTLGMLADSAMGFAALSMIPQGGEGVTAEYKINLLAPARGTHVIGRGTCLKAGRVLVCEGELFAVADGKETLVATALGTFVQTV
jgi:uncharacterized protein (TIGR00369 family)